MYPSLVTDAYTHQIVGHAHHEGLDTRGPLRALAMAIARVPRASLKGLIHHSDRGCQYCSAEYVGALRSRGMLVSMAEKGDPYENAVAERVNGILKTEWLNGMKLSRRKAPEVISGIVPLYNIRRPHASIDMLTPEQASKRTGPIPRRWKNYSSIPHVAANPTDNKSKNKLSLNNSGKPMQGLKKSNCL